MKWNVCLFADGDRDGTCKWTLMGTDGLVHHEVECLFADGDRDSMCKQILMGMNGLVRHEVECLFVCRWG